MDNQNNDNISTDINQEPIDMSSASVSPVKAPKKKAPIIIGSVLGVAAVGGVATALVLHFNDGAKDWVERKTSDPKEYFADKEAEYIKENTKNLSENMEKASEVYSAMDFKDFNLDNFKLPAGAYDITGTVSFDMDKISDIVMEFVPQQEDTTQINAALDVAKSFKSFAIGGKIVSDGDGLLSTTGQFTLNDNSVIDANLIVDANTKSIYVALPTVSDKYIKYTIPQEVLDEFNSQLEKSIEQIQSGSEEMAAAKNMVLDTCNVIADNSDEIAEIIADYYKIIIDGVKDDIEMDEDASLEIAGSEFSVVEMTTTIDADDVSGITKDILDTAKDDKNVKSIVSSMGFEDQFDEAIDEALKEVDSISESDIEVDISAWSDKKGNIIGHKFVVEDAELGYATLENKDNTYSSFWLNDGKDQKISIDVVTEGEDNESGTISYKIDTKEVYAVVTIDYENYEVVDASKGLVNFDAKISADVDIEDTDDEDVAQAMKLIKEITCNISSKCTEDSQEISYGVDYSGDSLVDFSIKCEKLSDTTVTLPADSDVITISNDPQELQSALISYLTSVNLVALKDNIKNSINNTMISTAADTLFTQAGLDKFNGTQTAEDVENLIAALDASNYGYDDDEDYDYDYDDDYGDGDDYSYDDPGLSFNDDTESEDGALDDASEDGELDFNLTDEELSDLLG